MSTAPAAPTLPDRTSTDTALPDRTSTDTALPDAMLPDSVPFDPHRSGPAQPHRTVTAPVAPAPVAPARSRPVLRDEPAPATWLTANIRPAGSFGRDDVGQLRALLDAVSACASLVVLDLAATILRSGHAAEAIDDAASALELRGGCLLCINADDDARARLGACRHAVVVPPGEPVPAGA